jgi:hypothetical protein
MRLVPITLAEARAFISQHHRHNEPPTGWRVGVGLSDGDKLIGVGVLSRPMARGSDDGLTAEVTRVAVEEGHKNANSMLYGALTRMAWAMGYDRLITYTLPEESGASLKATGWTQDAQTSGGDWARTAYKPGLRASDKLVLFYEPKMPRGEKLRWVKHRNA